MKPKTAIYLMGDTKGRPLKTPEAIEGVLQRMERLQPQGTLMFDRLTDHGAVHRCFIPAPTILRIEKLQ